MIALIPIILVLALSIKTKNVYFALLTGIVTATFIFTGYNPFATITELVKVIGSVTSDYIDILIYLALIGIFTYLISESGATSAFADKVILKLSTKKQTTFVTMLMGCICFVDDYFNILAVNSIMRPITDKNKMSREKLAYIVDATAGPVCEIVPISSWAGLVAASLPAMSAINGFDLYIKTIPFNLYPWLTLLFITCLSFMNFDFGYMKKLEDKASARVEKIKKETKEKTNAKAIDLIIPIIVSVISTILILLYSGGLFNGETLADAFANCEALPSLIGGMICTIFTMIIMYIPRKVVSPSKFVDSVTEGFKLMSTAMLILILAWTFSRVCGIDYLNFTGWVADLITNSHVAFVLLPMFLFLATFVLTLCTGASWAAIGLMVPLASLLFNDTVSPLMILTTAAIIGGGAAGDHIGPLSDTTVLSAMITDANYLDHVISQFQYGIIVVVVSAIGYLISGLTGILWSGMLFGIITIPTILFIIKSIQRRKKA